MGNEEGFPTQAHCRACRLLLTDNFCTLRTTVAVRPPETTHASKAPQQRNSKNAVYISRCGSFAKANRLAPLRNIRRLLSHHHRVAANTAHCSSRSHTDPGMRWEKNRNELFPCISHVPTIQASIFNAIVNAVKSSFSRISNLGSFTERQMVQYFVHISLAFLLKMNFTFVNSITAALFGMRLPFFTPDKARRGRFLRPG